MLIIIFDQKKKEEKKSICIYITQVCTSIDRPKTRAIQVNLSIKKMSFEEGFELINGFSSMDMRG